MKKIVLSIAAILAFGMVSAQATQGMKFGVKAGLNNSNFTGDADTNSKTGFYVGGFMDYGITANFHLQPELLYSMEGADDDLGVSYLKVPIMAKYYVIEGLNLQAGPYLGFKVATENDDFDKELNGFDFGIGAGAAYDLPIGLFFDARYNIGLQNINKNDADPSLDTKNTVIQVGVGYKF